MILAILAAAAAAIAQCPGAEVDFAHWEKHSIDRRVPVQIIMRASRALSACRKAGLNVPDSVQEYNAREVRTFTLKEAFDATGYKPPVEW